MTLLDARPGHPKPGLVSPPQTPQRGAGRSRVLLVGTGERAARWARQLLAGPATSTLVGALDNHPQPQLPGACPHVPWLGPVSMLRDVVREHWVDEVVIALPLRSSFDEYLEVGRVAREMGLAVHADMDLFPALLPALGAGTTGGVRVSWNVHPSCRFPGAIFKRAMDLVLGSLVILLLSPLLLLAALAVALDSRGPILFRQTRIGRGGRPFPMFKFRTMVPNAEELRASLEHRNDARGVSFKIIGDPRLTRAGGMLRRTSIDELPQLLNVLRGEMSLVGPRPLPSWVAEKLEDAGSHRRLCVLPGMTGLWQIRGRQQDFETMSKLDFEYVDLWSPGLDLWILLNTLPAVVRGENAH